MDIDDNLKRLGLILPEPPKPVGSYHPVVISGQFAFLSGQISRDGSGKLLSGKLGKELDLQSGQEAAKAAALNVISVIRNLVGFERFSRIVRIVGCVQADPDFYEISQVMNAASDLFIGVFGEKGIHARTSVGMASLPLNAAVEIEATIELNRVP